MDTNPSAIIQDVIKTATDESPGLTKQEYIAFVRLLTQAHSTSSELGRAIMEKVAPFDKELVRKFQAIQDAEDELVRYCRSKTETARELVFGEEVLRLR